jgi:hypothetical protein
MYYDGSRNVSDYCAPHTPFTGMLCLIALSYLLLDLHHRTSGPRVPLSLTVQAVQGVMAPGTAHDTFPSVALSG